MYLVFTVCDRAAAEPCPVWPGKPVTAHWGIQDPAMVEGPDIEKKRAFTKSYSELHRRIPLFINLPFEKLSNLALKGKLDDIGQLQ